MGWRDRVKLLILAGGTFAAAGCGSSAPPDLQPAPCSNSNPDTCCVVDGSAQPCGPDMTAPGQLPDLGAPRDLGRHD